MHSAAGEGTWKALGAYVCDASPCDLFTKTTRKEGRMAVVTREDDGKSSRGWRCCYFPLQHTAEYRDSSFAWAVQGQVGVFTSLDASGLFDPVALRPPSVSVRATMQPVRGEGTCRAHGKLGAYARL